MAAQYKNLESKNRHWDILQCANVEVSPASGDVVFMSPSSHLFFVNTGCVLLWYRFMWLCSLELTAAQAVDPTVNPKFWADLESQGEFCHIIGLAVGNGWNWHLRIFFFFKDTVISVAMLMWHTSVYGNLTSNTMQDQCNGFYVNNK